MKWFRHMSDASEDEFLARLERDLGLESYARWWKMLEAIAKLMDGSGRCEVEYPTTKWMSVLSIKREKILRIFLNYCENYQKISVQYSDKIIKIRCVKLLELRDEYSRKSGQNPDRYPDKVAPEPEPEPEKERIRTPLPPKSRAKSSPPPVASEAGSFAMQGCGSVRLGFGQRDDVPWSVLDHLTMPGYDKAKETANLLGWDFEFLLSKYNNDFIGKNGRKPPNNPDKAFNKWMLNFTKGQPPN